jgi:hypothetical protein
MHLTIRAAEACVHEAGEVVETDGGGAQEHDACG